MALKDTKGTCDDEMIVPFVALTIEAAVLRRLLCEPRSARGAVTDDRADDRRANPTFQGGWWRDDPHASFSISHPELVSGSYFLSPPFVTLEPKACRAQLVSGYYFRRRG